MLLVPCVAAPPGAAAEPPHRYPYSAESSGDASRSDFNRDGYADLAVFGQDWSGDGQDEFPGVVNVLYGSPHGLTRQQSQRWTAADFKAGDRSETFGEALATGDFDGDGYSDLAIGISELPLSDALPSNAGQVRVVYGSPSGLSRRRSQLWSQNTPGVIGSSEPEDGFGSSLVAANFGRGHQDDLAIGVSGENGQSGAVNVIYGSPTGLTADGNQFWSQASPGVPGKRETGNDINLGGDSFGATLAAGNFAGTVYADLAIGVPGDRVGHAIEAGSVNVLYGSAAGLTSKGSELWTQNTPGIKGRAKAGDNFGTSLATGHFAGRIYADLAIGAPNHNSGTANIIYGSPGGLTAKGDQLWSRSTRGLGGRKKLGSWFGIKMTSGNFGHDYSGRRYTDLAVRGDEPGTDGVGIVEVIYGSSSGLATKNSRGWNLDSRGIEGKMVPAGNDFGTSLAAGNFGNDFNGRAHDDLIVGDEEYDLGAFSVIYGSTSGLTAKQNKLWTGPLLGQPDLTYFGRAVAAG